MAKSKDARDALALAETDVAVTGALDEDLGRIVQPRDLLPTPRELEIGQGTADQEFTPVVEEKAPRKSAREHFRDYVRGADPRAVGKPAIPIIVFGLMQFIGILDDMALPLLIPEIRAEFAFDVRFLVTIVSLGAVLQGLFAPLIGYLADRMKRVYLARAAALIQNLSTVMAALAPGIPVYALARVMGQAGLIMGQPVQGPLLADYYPPQVRVRAFTFIGIGGALGFAIGPLLAGLLSEAYGWRVAVGTLAVPALLVALGTFLLKEPIRGYHERKAAGAGEEAAKREQKALSLGEAVRASASITTVRCFWYATMFLPASAFGTIFFGVLLADQGLGPRQRGYIFAGAGLAAVLGMPFAGSIADRLLAFQPARVLVFLGTVKYVQAGAFLVAAFTNQTWLTILLLVPATFGHAAIQPATSALMSVVVPPRLRGLGMQTIRPFMVVGGILSFAWLLGLAPLLENFTPSDNHAILAALAVPTIIAGLFVVSAASAVGRDIRAARAGAMADEEARRSRAAGRNKMLICRDVDVTYDGTQVLFGVDFDVEEGELVALLGTNGAGKSTLMRAIAGIAGASNGAIYLDGEDITHEPPHRTARRGIVMVPGGHAVFPTLTVEENLQATEWAVAVSDAGADGAEDEDTEVAGKADEHGNADEGSRMEEVLDLFPILRERFHQPAGNLSGGEQQMLALAQAFMMRPRLLLIDELSLGLAPQIVQQLLDTLRKVHATGITIVLIEQSLNVATTIARRAVFMEKGEIRFDGPTEELLRKPDLIRAVFMGGAAVGGGARRVRAREETEADVLLAVDDVSVSFGGVSALRGASLALRRDEIVGIIGANGAGKTTLFDVISGFVTPDAGTVSFDDRDITDLAPDARARLGLGRSFQNARLFPALTVRENIAVAMERRLHSRSVFLSALWASPVRKSERVAARRVDALIEVLGLQAYADKFVNEVSTGTRRSVDVACIMASQPKVLLLDEPSSGLAQAETEELGPVIERIAREADCSILVIEHDLGLVSSVSHRMIAMELGSVLMTGTPTEVVNDPRVVRSYMADAGAVHRSDLRGALPTQR